MLPSRAISLSLLLLLVLVVAGCRPAASGDALTIEAAWARPVLAHGEGDDASSGHEGEGSEEHAEGATGNHSAAYLRIRNNSAAPDRLLGGHVEFATVELHQTTITDGIARMGHVTEGVPIPPGGMLALEPGGYHLMLVDVQRALSVGETFDLTLSFEAAGDIIVPVTVRAP